LLRGWLIAKRIRALVAKKLEKHQFSFKQNGCLKNNHFYFYVQA
jgi:hypothetical protein